MLIRLFCMDQTCNACNSVASNFKHLNNYIYIYIYIYIIYINIYRIYIYIYIYMYITVAALQAPL